MFQYLTLRTSVSWDDVFTHWQNQEGSDPAWHAVAKDKGWESWEAWRSYQSAQIDAGSREWNIYRINNPNELVPAFRIGPFRAWQQHFETKNIYTFADLVRMHTEWVRDNTGVQARIHDFPFQAQFIGLFIEEDDYIVLFEGHHRAAAIALAVYDHAPIVFTSQPTIALASMKKDETQLLHNLLERGTGNPLKFS